MQDAVPQRRLNVHLALISISISKYKNYAKQTFVCLKGIKLTSEVVTSTSRYVPVHFLRKEHRKKSSHYVHK